MTIQSKWVWIVGAIAGVVIAVALGVPLGTLLIVGAILLCPAAMYFGMRGRGQRGEHRSSGRDQRDR